MLRGFRSRPSPTFEKESFESCGRLARRPGSCSRYDVATLFHARESCGHGPSAAWRKMTSFLSDTCETDIRALKATSMQQKRKHIGFRQQVSSSASSTTRCLRTSGSSKLSDVVRTNAPRKLARRTPTKAQRKTSVASSLVRDDFLLCIRSLSISSNLLVKALSQQTMS